MGRQTRKQWALTFFKVGDNESVPTCTDPENSVRGPDVFLGVIFSHVINLFYRGP